MFELEAAELPEVIRRVTARADESELRVVVALRTNNVIGRFFLDTRHRMEGDVREWLRFVAVAAGAPDDEALAGWLEPAAGALADFAIARLQK